MAEFSRQESVFFAMLAAAIIAVCLALVFLVVLSRAPEPYTELYFDLGSIQSSASPAESLGFRFFVENHEGGSMDYTYSVLVNESVVEKGRLSLAGGEKTAVSESVVLPDERGNQKIGVEVENAFQERYSIFFWVETV
jgi:hypothetical protein